MALPPGVKVTFVDRPELAETFVDSFESFMFNNNLLRLEMCCIRFQTPTPPAQPAGRKVPVARIVMPLETTVELFNQLNQLFGALEKTGLIRKEESGAFVAPPGQKSH